MTMAIWIGPDEREKSTGSQRNMLKSSSDRCAGLVSNTLASHSVLNAKFLVFLLHPLSRI